jgi:hypothetical protein
MRSGTVTIRSRGFDRIDGMLAAALAGSLFAILFL